MKTAIRALGMFAVLLFAFAAGESSAQSYPSKPIKLLVGFAPGGGTGILGGLIAQKLSESLGVPVTVENRPRANGNIVADFAAKSPPDGYTLLVGGSATMAISAGLYERLPFDPLKDFVPIAQIVTGDAIVFAVHPSDPPNSINELIAYAAHP